ncbi:hypothetical protein OUZ56_010616 [Daphnia magna]|uniref:Uncharacterized protein n=1 Tax=Daphnia magna TaxID=35525 RepID=A0ABR0AJ13_9CRUS|nr:hypothetical protein OUZ56_010616 [Daphnia magna]
MPPTILPVRAALILWSDKIDFNPVLGPLMLDHDSIKSWSAENMAQCELLDEHQQCQSFHPPCDSTLNLNPISGVLKESLLVKPCPVGSEQLWDRILHYIGQYEDAWDTLSVGSHQLQAYVRETYTVGLLKGGSG